MHHRYSRLIGADEGSTLQAFKTICAEPFDPTIAAHNGRLVIDALNRSSICAQGETEAGPVGAFTMPSGWMSESRLDRRAANGD